MPIFQVSQTIMVYMALSHEVQTTAMITAARQHQKRVVIPVVRGRELVVAVCPTEAAHLQPGPYGILEPCEVYTIVPPQEIDCIFVPGVGFDVRGARLGFGQGYYDRFLRQLPSTTAYGGLAFHVQIVPCVPHMEHDVRMQFVVTEQGVIPCRHTLSYGPPRWTVGQDEGEER
jgi:5-formyltetrahydrofolate cyclo-ligase